MITTKTYIEPRVNKKEILRYAGCKNPGQETAPISEAECYGNFELLLDETLHEVLPRLRYKVCFSELSVQIADEVCDFGCMKVQSKDLAKNLAGCKKVLLFAATIGVDIDRLIAKYARISPAKAVLIQAIGAERIEALCDTFCEDMAYVLRPRFSPGYGDLPLEMQKEILQILESSKHIGLTLNDSMLMSPSKSVTAFVGIVEQE